MSELGPISSVSVIVPMRNEADHVDDFVRDLAAQDYTGALEVLVADGQSDDGSPERLRACADRAGLRLELVPNPKRIVSPGLNECIRRATGGLIVRLDCHSRYPADYLRRCVEAAEETGAWNVGGRVVAEGRTPAQKAVARAMSSPFGGIDWTRHGGSTGRVDVDTVTFGAFRPEAFRAVGLYDETFVRNQDDELNLRILKAGGRIVLDPTIHVSYLPRGSWRGVLRQYYAYGLWKPAVMLKHRRVLSARSLAPIGLVGSLAGLVGLAPFSRLARRLLGAEVALYAGAALVFARRVVRDGDEPVPVASVAAVFPAFHLGYGAGMAVGLARALGRIARGALAGRAR